METLSAPRIHEVPKCRRLLPGHDDHDAVRRCRILFRRETLQPRPGRQHDLTPVDKSTLTPKVTTVENSPAPMNSDKHPIGLRFFFWGEFAERCSYYGMRAILFLYLTTQLKMSDG